MLIGEGVSCRFLYPSVSYLYVNCTRLITSVGEERAHFSAIVYCLLAIMWFLLGGVSSWNRLRYFIVAVCGPSI